MITSKVLPMKKNSLQKFRLLPVSLKISSLEKPRMSPNKQDLPGSYLFRDPSNQNVGLSVSSTIENRSRWGRSCYG